MTVVVRSSPLKIVDQEIIPVLLEEMKVTGIDVRLKAPHDSVERC